MHKESTTWFAATAFAGLTFSLVTAGTVVAQPPGRGPGGPDGPGRGGPPNVAEMFSRMDQNKDGKLSKDEVPGLMWERLSHLDRDGDGWVTKDEVSRGMPGGGPDGRRSDGASPDGAKPAGSPSDRSREDQSSSRGPRPPMAQPRGEASRAPERGPRDTNSEHGRPAPPHSPGQPGHERSAQPDHAHRGPAAFGPDAFFDRLDKNGDGSLSRDEFKAVVALHHGLRASHGPQGFGGHPGPGGPPLAHHGPGMPGGGPPWAQHDRADSHGPRGFHGGPPWAGPGHGPRVHGKFAGPPRAQHSPPDRDAGHGKKHKGHDKKKGNNSGKKKHQHDRSDSDDRGHHRHSDTESPNASGDLVTIGNPQQTLPL